jgi:Family of unknown function (DUF5681)
MKRNSDHPGTAQNESTSAATEIGADTVGDARTGRRRSSRNVRSNRSRSGNRPGNARRARDLAALLSAALDGSTTVTEDGKRRRVTKREAIAAQLVDRSTNADLQATKLLVDLLSKIQPSAGMSGPEQLDAADEKVIATVLARLGMAE